MKTMLRDFAFLLRQVSHRPLLHILIVFILALGIGANTAMFTLTDAVLFRDLPVDEPETLARIFSARERGGAISNSSWPTYEETRTQVDNIAAAAGFVDWISLDVEAGNGVERVDGGLATGNFFDVIGVQPVLGRVFNEGDDENFGAHPVAVLSHHYWRTRFNESRDVIGHEVTINLHTFTIIGVLPHGFTGLNLDSPVDVWLPMSMAAVADPGYMPSMASLRDPRRSWLDIVARLRPGATFEQLQAELDAQSTVRAEAEAKATETFGAGPWRIAMPANDAAVDPYGFLELRRNAVLLNIVVMLVLLLACANVAGLLGVRAEEREREFAVRASLGASRRRLVGMLVAETLLLVIAGALAGLLFAGLMLDAVAAFSPRGIVLPRDGSLAVLDGRVLGLTLIAALVVTLLTAFLPAWRASRSDAGPALRGGAASTSMPSRVALRATLVTVQIGISALILVGALLLLRSFWNTVSVDPGFETRNAVMTQVDVSRLQLDDAEQLAFFTRLRQRVLALPGVESAGFAQTIPVQSGGWMTSIEVQGDTQEKDRYSNLYVVTPGFLETLGPALVSGRMIDARDMQPDSEPVVVINETFAERFWPEGNALGRRVENHGEGGSRVIGIVADHKLRNLRETPQRAMYVPLSQSGTANLHLLVRSSRSPAALFADIRNAIHAMNPELPVLRQRTLEEHVTRSYADAELFAWLLGGFAALALLLAAAGLYGMLAHVLRLRQREFGIRMALGAANRMIAVLVVRQIALLVVAGLLAGLALSLAGVRMLETLLFGVDAFDAATFGVVIIVVLLVAALASLLPVRHAATTEPMRVLREE